MKNRHDNDSRACGHTFVSALGIGAAMVLLSGCAATEPGDAAGISAMEDPVEKKMEMQEEMTEVMESMMPR